MRCAWASNCRVRWIDEKRGDARPLELQRLEHLYAQHVVEVGEADRREGRPDVPLEGVALVVSPQRVHVRLTLARDGR